MRRIDALFREYEAFHRDRRNKLCHYVGITTIVLGVLAAFDQVAIPGPAIGAWGPPTLALPVALALVLFYATLDVPLAIGSLLILVGLALAGKFTGGWIGAVALFVGGWALQFLGHAFEGKKPAFFRNAVHLLVGPLWILGHLYELLGLRSKRAAA